MWNDEPDPDDAIADHETNPEYETHIGQVTSDGRRRISVWFQGQRWTGWLEPAGDPDEIRSPLYGL